MTRCPALVGFSALIGKRQLRPMNFGGVTDPLEILTQRTGAGLCCNFRQLTETWIFALSGTSCKSVHKWAALIRTARMGTRSTIRMAIANGPYGDRQPTLKAGNAAKRQPLLEKHRAKAHKDLDEHHAEYGC